MGRASAKAPAMGAAWGQMCKVSQRFKDWVSGEGQKSGRKETARRVASL